MWASRFGRDDVVDYLLKLPVARATMDEINMRQQPEFSAVSVAASNGHSSTVQLLLDAGADPTIPANAHSFHCRAISPLSRAISGRHDGTATLLRRAIAEPERTRALYKARSFIDAALAVDKVRTDARAKGQSPVVQLQKAGIVPGYLKGRVEQQQPMPQAKMRFRVSKTQISLQKGAREGPRTKLQKSLIFDLVGVWRDRRPASTQGAVKAITWRMLAREQYRTAAPDRSQTLALTHILLPIQQIDKYY